MKVKTASAIFAFAVIFATSADAQFHQGYGQPVQGQPIQQGQPIYQQPGQAWPQGTIVQGQPIQGQPMHALPGQPVQPQVARHWSQNFTDETSHEFGTVAKASRQEHTFEFVNNLDCDLYLVGIGASCGCTIPTIKTPVVKPGETAQVHAKFDTVNFDGERGATISVALRRHQPYTETSEVQFTVKGLIRRDVVVHPGVVDFTNALEGQSVQKQVQVMFAGDPQWAIREVQSSNPNITAELTETRRDEIARRVDYNLTVTLSNGQEAGQFIDNLTLVTTDAANQNISVDIQGQVLSMISASDVNLGVIEQGSKITKKIIIRGKRPFRITDVIVNSPAITILEHEGEGTLHVIEYTLDTSKSQSIDDEIRFQTSDPLQAEACMKFSAQIVPATFASQK